MKYYKLTDKKGQTYGGLQWGENVSHKATGKGKELCTDAVIHFYIDPYLAVFANPIHAKFDNPRLWEGKAKRIVNRDALKGGCKEFTTIRELPLPTITMEQRVEIAVRCAMKVHLNDSFQKWATEWLVNKDRTTRAADDAADAAYAAYAAGAAPFAAFAVAYAAGTAAAYSAPVAAYAAGAAAAYAAAGGFNLIDIIYKAVGVKQ